MVVVRRGSNYERVFYAIADDFRSKKWGGSPLLKRPISVNGRCIRNIRVTRLVAPRDHPRLCQNICALLILLFLQAYILDACHQKLLKSSRYLGLTWSR